MYILLFGGDILSSNFKNTALQLNRFLLDRRKSKNHEPWLLLIMQDARAYESMDSPLSDRNLIHLEKELFKTLT